MTRARDDHTATLLPDGTVLIAGGETVDCINGVVCFVSGTTADAESYDPSTGTFAKIGDMTASRGGHMAILLQNGTVLIAGGYASGPTGTETLNSAEVYTPLVVAPVLAVTDLQFDRTTVASGAYSVQISGSNLNALTFFDVRFRAPGSSLDQEALNWQRGTSGSHTVSPGIATGVWIVTGVRGHQLETDHTGNSLPVTATITVSSVNLIRALADYLSAAATSLENTYRSPYQIPFVTPNVTRSAFSNKKPQWLLRLKSLIL